MSSELLRNLSFSGNLRESTVFSEDVAKAVNKTLNKFYFETLYRDYLTFYKQHKNLIGAEKNSSVMQSEKIILCEINAGLWVKAIKSAVNSLNQESYPHYIIVQEFINYLLNAETNENFGLLENFFWQLLLFHPPSPGMFEYYSQILFNNFVTLNDKTTEEHNLLVCLLEACSSLVEIMVNSNGNECSFDVADENDETNFENLERERLLALKNLDCIITDTAHGKINVKKTYFGDLRWNARMKRCLIALSFVYNVLEADVVFWLDSRDWKPFLPSAGQTRKERRSLLSLLLWSNAGDVGLINKEVHRILDLYGLLKKSNSSYQCRNVIEKFVILIGEVIRCSDSFEEINYPFVGRKCEDFFRELSIILHQIFFERYRKKNRQKEDELLVSFKPPWLRLFLCSHLLSSVTGSQCVPELTTAHDILLHVIHGDSGNEDAVKTKPSSRKVGNSKLLQKLRNLKSINAKLGNGKTHLHMACEENDVEKIKALLTFPELDVNVTDREGWTALHRAAHAGNVASVEELLTFLPKRQHLQKCLNTRARGPQSITPIMFAAIRNHADVCTLLLEHSGSILLEDTNELNQTALELAATPEVKKILENHKKNNALTYHSHMSLSLDPEMKPLVLRLCVEMIQAYFCTHRTWDVYGALKKSKTAPPEGNIGAPDLEGCWDYMRYQRDIKRNIYKLRKLIPMLENVDEFKGLHDLYVRLLTFNKIC